jgi:hypothetical protein
MLLWLVLGIWWAWPSHYVVGGNVTADGTGARQRAAACPN